MSRRALVLSYLLAALSACSKAPTEGAASTAAAAASPAAAARPAARTGKDFKTPYLTEEKISRFLQSAQEAERPLALLSEDWGQAVDIAQVKERKEELDAFARKYGFADYEEYLSVWGRILLAESIMMAEQMRDSTSGALDQMIENAQMHLKDPALSPSMRRLYEEQLAGARNSLEQLRRKTEDSPLNAADFELIRSRRAEIDEAIKKVKKPKG